ncbi:MAG: hypothetical protein RLZZ627_1142 [Pseudomonadota bacterium]|jgi:hypothetical protein
MTNLRLKTPRDSLLNHSLLALALSLTLAMTGCDSGSKSASQMSSEAFIEGYLSDIHGPLSTGKLEVKDKNDRIILSQQLEGQNNHFAIKVPAGTTYPILLVFTPPAGGVSQVVRAVVTSPLADRMDVTDITSLVVDAAFALGGLTEENIAKASGGAIGLRQRQGVSAGAGGGGSGAGQSAGGVSRGGHGGHDMSGSGAPGAGGTGTEGSMEGMKHE